MHAVSSAVPAGAAHAPAAAAQDEREATLGRRRRGGYSRHGGPFRGHGHADFPNRGRYDGHRGAGLGVGDRQWLRLKHSFRHAGSRMRTGGLMSSLAIGAGLGATAGAILPVFGPISGALVGAAAGAVLSGSRSLGALFGGHGYGYRTRHRHRSHVIAQPMPYPVPVPMPMPMVAPIPGFGHGYMSPGVAYGPWH